MDFNRVKGIFATGEIGPKPKIFLWDSSMREISVFKGGVIKGVCSLRFSPSGSKLAAACIDDNHMVVVFDVASGNILGCEKGDTAKIVDLEWESEESFVSVGIKHFKTWTLAGG